MKANVHTTGSKRARALLEIEDSGDSDPGGGGGGGGGERSWTETTKYRREGSYIRIICDFHLQLA